MKDKQQEEPISKETLSTLIVVLSFLGVLFIFILFKLLGVQL